MSVKDKAVLAEEEAKNAQIAAADYERNDK